jgi:hypothetical protein
MFASKTSAISGAGRTQSAEKTPLLWPRSTFNVTCVLSSDKFSMAKGPQYFRSPSHARQTRAGQCGSAVSSWRHPHAQKPLYTLMIHNPRVFSSCRSHTAKTFKFRLKASVKIGSAKSRHRTVHVQCRNDSIRPDSFVDRLLGMRKSQFLWKFWMVMARREINAT